MVEFARNANVKILTSPRPSFQAKGRAGQSSADLLPDIEQDTTSQPRDESWEGASDHTSILYEVRNANLKVGKRRVSKSMLHNMRNREEAGERYIQVIPWLVERAR